jgi:uncharacterized tellurite resistance protein B-like protein
MTLRAMFGRWSKRAADDPEGHALASAVREHLPDADEDTRAIVTALAGLLGGVAYADRDYGTGEENFVRAQLERVQGLSSRGIGAILAALRDHIVDIATTQAPRYSRTLRELADRELRLQVLDMLVELAAADERISHDEVVLLRTTATSLGLDQSDYNAVQAKHRDKLGVLGQGSG